MSNPLSKSSIFLEVIEQLSKNTSISDGDIFEFAKELVHKAAHFLKLSRVNVWMYVERENKLENLIAYDLRDQKLYKEEELFSSDFPVYFNHITRSEIIISPDAQQEPFNEELVDSYLIPNDIQSMLEIPIISGGKLQGIICFEHTGSKREWNHDEQHFALALTQLFTITLETKLKNRYHDELEILLKEKNSLLEETNHRVINNLTIISALTRQELKRSKDEYHRKLFENLLSRTFTLSTLQNILYETNNFHEIDFSLVINNIVAHINDTMGHDKNVELRINLDDTIRVDINNATPCALILNELLTNSYKFAFQKDRKNILDVEFKKENGLFELAIGDNGPGLPLDYKSKGSGFGFIDGLIEQIDGEMIIKTDLKGICTRIRFK